MNLTGLNHSTDVSVCAVVVIVELFLQLSSKCPFYLSKSNKWSHREAWTEREETLKQHVSISAAQTQASFATSVHQTSEEVRPGKSLLSELMQRDEERDRGGKHSLMKEHAAKFNNYTQMQM